VAAFRSLRAAGASALEAAEVINLANTIDLVSKAYLHERRGAGGKWVGSGPRIGPPKEQRARARARLIAQGRLPAPAQPATVQSLREKHATIGQLARAQEQTAKIATEAAQIHVQKMIKQVHDEHAQYVKDVTAAQSAEDAHKAHLKFFAIMASLIGGAIIGAITAGLGLPVVASLAVSISPAAAEALFEMKKRL